METCDHCPNEGVFPGANASAVTLYHRRSCVTATVLGSRKSTGAGLHANPFSRTVMYDMNKQTEHTEMKSEETRRKDRT